MEADRSRSADETHRTEAEACHQRSANETSSGDSRHRNRLAAGTSGCDAAKRGARRASPARVVRCEKYSPPGLSDSPGNAAVGKKSDRLFVDSRFSVAPGTEHLEP